MRIKDDGRGTMRIQVNGAALYVFEQPAIRNQHSAISTPALVFLHYFGGSSGVWREVVDALAVEYHCIAPDLRGFGDSEATANNYALDDYANDVVALVSSLGIERYTLVGHSMGGKIALLCAARRLPGLQSLVLLAPSPPTPEPIKDDERARLLATYGDRAAAEETARKITAHTLAAPMLEQVIEDSLRSSPTAWRAWLERGSREDIAAEMSKVNIPVLVVAGALDQSITAALLQSEVVELIAGARLIVLPDAAHLLPLESTEAVADLIRKHCEEMQTK